MTILYLSPNAATIKVNQTRKFSVPDATFDPKWGVRSGVGTIDSFGQFSSASKGDSVVRAMSEMWQTLPAQITSLADNTLFTLDSGTSREAKSFIRLTASGQGIEWIYSSDFEVRLYDGLNFFNTNNGDIRWNTTVEFSGALSAGDRIRWDWSGANVVRIIINGSTEFLNFSHNITQGNLQPAIVTKTATPSATTIPALLINGDVVGYQEGTADVKVLADIITPVEGVEFYAEARLETVYSNGNDVSTIHDESGHGRDLTAGKTKPTFATGAIAGQSTYRWSSGHNPAIQTVATLVVKCGWVLAKYNGSSFPDPIPTLGGYKGLLTDATGSVSILVGDHNSTNFNIFSSMQEYRLSDHIYTQNHPAPMNEFGLIFFRYWEPVKMTTLQLGQWGSFGTTTSWDGDIPLVALYSQDFSEEAIRSNSKLIADKYGLTLADVYPYQADYFGVSESAVQTVNTYDPPEGDRVVEAIGDVKETFQLTFSVADQAEVDVMKTYHAAHYSAATPCYYRDYRFTPPRDIEGYIDSQYNLDGAVNNFQYSFSFRQR